MLGDLLTVFWLGFLTPASPCVIALYPGFLAYLSNLSKIKPLTLSLFIAIGISSFMLLFGILFTLVFKVALDSVIGVLSPIAFAILGIVSLMLIFDFDFSKITPAMSSKTSKKPWLEAFGFGFFFGLIVIPCNPGFIVAFLAGNLGVTAFISALFQFLVFGLGMASPLILLSAISMSRSKQIIGFLTNNKRAINLIAGMIMLAISLYYLIYVFEVF